MKIQKNNLPKFAALVGLSVIILFSSVFGLSRHGKRNPDFSKPITTASLIIPVNENLSLRDSLVNFGMKFLDTPYLAGGSSRNGFDCSGFVYFVFRHFKIPVPRSSSQFSNFGKEIPIDSIQRGDILVFLSPTRNAIGHVGIVSNAKGKDSDFIHASSGKESKVIITSLKQERYKRRFVKAVNVLQ